VEGHMDPTTASERPIAAALNWLARHQMPDGRWSLQDFSKQCKGEPCSGPGTAKSDAAATALGVLPFLAAGQTHATKGPYRKAVYDALYWLMRNQKRDGDLSAGGMPRMYAHGMATIALCEAYGMTKNKALGKSAQQAVQFIEAAQHPKTGGWRYEPGQEGDTSVTGWQVTALKSAELAGLKVDPKAFEGAKRWLKSVAKGDNGGQFSYVPDSKASPSMTAVGLRCMGFLGAGRSDPALNEAVRYLSQNPPDEDLRDVYYWYAATQALQQFSGPDWDNWNRRVRRTLIESQVRDGCAAGSWDPQNPIVDRWGQAGRLVTTSLSVLSLEVYYRYLPIYKLDASKPVEK